jgi:serine/threonine-protein kinase RIO1
MSNNENNIIETRISKIYWEDKQNGIIIAIVKPKTEVKTEDLIEDYEVYKNNFHHPNRKIIIDITEVGSTGKEARDYMAGPEGVYNYFEAVAFISYSKFNIGSILIHVAMKIYPLRKPTNIFYNKQDAINWLMSIK